MKTFVIGVPRERKEKEGRVGMTPNGVRKVLDSHRGTEVHVECGAGVLAGFSDKEYLAAGAVLVSDVVELYRGASMIVKVKEPMPEEYPLLQFLRHKPLFTYLHLAGVDPELTSQLLRHDVTAIAYETVERIEGAKHTLPLLVPMSIIAGTQGARQGIQYAEKNGCVSPNVVIIGGGVVGEAALCEAIERRAASVSLFELRKERVCALRKQYRTPRGVNQTKISFMTMESMNGKRGVAVLADAHVVVCAVLNPGGPEAPKVLTADHFAHIKKGCYIVDVAIDQGGSTEWSRQTKPGETYEQGGLTFSCTANIPGSTVPKEATVALTKETLPYVLLFAQYAERSPCGWLLLSNHKDIRSGLQTWLGCVTNKFVSEKHNLGDQYRPIEYFFGN